MTAWSVFPQNVVQGEVVRARIFSAETSNRDRDRYRFRNRFRDVLNIEPFDCEPDPDSDSESGQNHFSHTEAVRAGLNH